MSQYMPLLQKFAVLKVASSSVEEISSGITAVADWEGFLAEAESHGLSSLILKHMEEHGLDVPPTAKLALKALFVRHRAIADARYTVAAELLDRLQTAGFPALILKGLALSPLLYPHDSLRPMRDVDILIPRQKKAEAAKIIRELGFELLDVHHDKYMRDSNQMPNAWKMVNGFKISVELHHDAIGRDSPGHLYYEDISPTQSVHWRDLVLETLGHEQMLHQLCSHLEGRHPGSLLKLINIADVTLYSEQFIDQVDWPSIAHNYPHVINTLKCLHLVVPLSNALQHKIGGVSDVKMQGVGEIMPTLKDIVRKDMTTAAKLRAFFLPSDWWLHLFYGVPPQQSLVSVKLWRHPITMIPFIGRRIISRVLGG